jgi:hypothetical protein
MTLEKFHKDPRVEQLMEHWDVHANRTELKSLYWDVLWAAQLKTTGNVVELVNSPDFDDLIKPKPDERLSKEKLLALLKKAGDLAIEKPAFFPGPVEAFDFLIIVNDVAGRSCEKWPHLKDGTIDEAMLRLAALAQLNLYAAIHQNLVATLGN